MTFNWPDVPFSGTEVDAFVAEYKSFAQDVLDSYDSWGTNTDGNAIAGAYSPPGNVIGHHLPYHTKENLKVYLESALVYSAFVVKQRAGNLGPGTNFTLGNSPLNVELDEPQTKRLNEKLNCDWADGEFEMCFGGDGPPPNFNPPGGPPPEIEDNAGPPGGDAPPPDDPDPDDPDPDDPDPDGPDAPEDPNKEWEKEDCLLKIDNWAGEGTVGSEFVKNAFNFAVKVIVEAFATVGRLGDVGLLYAGQLLRHYINGSGTTWTKVYAGTKSLIENYMNGKEFKQTVVTPAMRTAWGMSETDRAYAVDFAGIGYFAFAFGTATIITDGGETQTTKGVLNHVYGTDWQNANIKRLVDDYDFFYGWEVIRSYTGDDFPGMDVVTIKGGRYYCPENYDDPINTIPDNTADTPCEALAKVDETNGLDRVIRAPVAIAHPGGCIPFDDARSFVTGKPFGVNLSL